MPFVLTILVVAVALSYLRGGRVGRLDGTRIRWPWVVVLGLGVQVAVELLAPRFALDPTSIWVGLLLSQLVLVGFTLGNLRFPGMALIGVGLVCNAVVIAANGGMPVDPAAIRVLGFEGPVALPPGRYTLLDDGTHLPWLGDILPLPWLRAIVSPGDLVLAAGLIPFVHALLLGTPRASDPDTRRDHGPTDLER